MRSQRPKKPVKRSADERCPEFDPSANKHSKKSLEALGTIKELERQMSKCNSIHSAKQCVPAGRSNAGNAAKTISAGLGLRIGGIRARGAPASSSSAAANAAGSGNAAQQVGTAVSPSEEEVTDLLKLEIATTAEIGRDFMKIPKAGPSDWLSEHDEVGQTTLSFYRRCSGMFAKPTKTRNALYVQPLGTLSIALPKKKEKKADVVGGGDDEGGSAAASSSESGKKKRAVSRNRTGGVSSSSATTKKKPAAMQDMTAEKEEIIRKSGLFFREGSPVLKYLKSYLEAFFHGMDVKIEKYKQVDVEFRENDWDGSHQIHAGQVINDELPKLRLKMRDSYALLGITMEDLYPRDSWNFVFGLANMMERNGVFSLARYGGSSLAEEMDPEPEEGDKKTAPGGAGEESVLVDPDAAFRQKLKFARLLKRALKTMSHELCHCFGIKHCIHFNCLMQGSNHAAEGEKKMHALCPVCLRKLYFALEFDVVERYKKLKAWCDDLVNEFDGDGIVLNDEGEIVETSATGNNASSSGASAGGKGPFAFVFGDWSEWYGRRIAVIEGKC